MKKLLMMLLFISLVSPSFAYADNKSERGNGNDSHKSSKSAYKSVKNETKEIKEAKKEVVMETKSHKSDNDDDKYKSYYSTTTPVVIATYTMTTTTTLPVKISKKINYFLCKTDTGLSVVSLEGEKSKNSANELGEYCIKLPYGFAKRFGAIIGSTPGATTTPDILAPVISGVGTSVVTASSATISWNTNEPANGNIYVSATSPVNMSTATTLGTTTLSTLHSFNLSGLTASTTYYYVVKSADSSSNTATSSMQSFVTGTIVDTTAPIISGVVTSPVASTTATVSWNTNELATGKLWYGTSTPLTAYVQNTTLLLPHVFNLTGLTASTTYSLLIESTDSANNIATSSASLVTTN